MQLRYTLFFAVLPVVTVFLIMAGWEFVIEDFIVGLRIADGNIKSHHEHWEYILTATAATAVTWGVSGPILLRVASAQNRADRPLGKGFDTLDQLAKDGTSDLKNEISRRTRTEQALIESEARYRAIVEDQSEPLCRTSPDGTFTFVNDSYCKYLEKTREELIGQNFVQFVPEHDRAEVRDAMALMDGGAQATSTEHRIVEPDGRIRWQEWTVRALFGSDGQVEQFQATGRDITERKRNELSLRLLASIVETSADAITAETPDGIITHWNPAAVDMYGFTAEDAIGEHISIITPSDRANEIPMFREETGPGRRIKQFETVRRHKNGEQLDISLSVAPIVDAAGKMVALTAIHRDIGKRKRTELAIREAKEAAENANRAKSDFLATMSHEIRTPMNGVLGMAGVLLGTDLTQEQRDQVETIRHSGESLLTILNDILDFSKLDAGYLELEIVEFELDDVTRSVVELMSPQAHAKGLQISTSLAPGTPGRLEGDPGRLRQILLNLMGNAIKFTDRGSVSVRVTPEQRSGDAAMIRFEVADTGAGIPEDAQARLFTRFTQVDASMARKFGGTGLGLAICQELCALMGGEIGLDSSLGQGSRFWFTASFAVAHGRKTEDAADHRDGESDAVRSGPQGLRILLAEDNHVNQKVVMAMLKGAGHIVDIAANGIEAVEAVSIRPYDVVLMDIQMPEMDGIKATRRIRALKGKQAQIPIIALTANAMKGDRERYLDTTMDDYVSKPIDPIMLHEAIARQCGTDAEAAATVTGALGRTAASAEAQEELANFIDFLDDVKDPSG